MHQQVETIKQAHAFPIVKMRRLMEETDILHRVTELASLGGSHSLLVPALAILCSYSEMRLWISLTIGFYRALTGITKRL